MNVVVIISDTLRRDHLGLYGNQIVRTPHLDRFAQRCMVFDRAYPASFPTIPMRADFFTGRFTFTHLGWAPLPKDAVILTQLLADAGYRTGAVVDTHYLIAHGFNYDRGFHDFRLVQGQGGGRQDYDYERRYEEDYIAPRTGALAERWIERHQKDKFFLYVDMWDPHEPWDPPVHYIEQYYQGWDGGMVARPCYNYWKDRGLTRKDVDFARACYAGEVTMVDRAVGRIIERLDSLGLLEETLVVFTADHGHYLGEHGMLGKHISEPGKMLASPLYEEITRVPLLVHLPGGRPGRTDAIVQSPDLMPTILELVGVETPDTVQARSVASIAETGKGEERAFAVTSMPLCNPGHITLSTDNYQRMVVSYLRATISSGPWTMLYAREGTPVELYDLRSDPGQMQNVAEEHPDVVRRLHQWYFELIESSGAPRELLEPRAAL